MTTENDYYQEIPKPQTLSEPGLILRQQSSYLPVTAIFIVCEINIAFEIGSEGTKYLKKSWVK